ncbi:hypothetical protein HL653_06215 [Sphingomonas sp. AP4-R1]|uniref:hypothetical protein n=1 Tax=Sphingomonas sp. AP4-R1 TaxID=2735134 RepID=UPI001493A00F|nr:hypothetical protein [Sphingomonas sp. AP4-R1]QJU57440.1 hypothetical protein HL653_06215 [Sphingomonas sp. AP4-R1]
MMLLGGLVLAAAAFSLITGIATDAIPANWPFEPKSREEHPKAFRLYIRGWTAAAVIGAILLLLGLIRG